MKVLLITIIILLIPACSGKYYIPDEVAYGHVTGTETNLITSGLKSNEHMATEGFEVRASKKVSSIRYGLESAVTKHDFSGEQDFEGITVDAELFAVWEKEFLNDWYVYGGFGGGLGVFIEEDGRHPLIHQDQIIGVLDVRVGVRKDFDVWFIDLTGKIDHYSGLDSGDKGLNYGVIEGSIGFKF